ncbi:MAG: PIN domain-containing protein [Bifidobacteriaceae bacterium]|jgi:predicted nucleic acid-binding protein|nr:PIN domain-containing protein [Bifidobacteriaceae bacterium]
MIPPVTPVVFDINVYLDYILGGDGSWPLLPNVPPTTANPAADAVSLAFAASFRLFASPHILRNIVRVTRAAGQSQKTTGAFAAAVAEMCEFSGGAVIEPETRDHGIGDYEDSLVLSLAKDPAVDALVIVGSDHHLLDVGKIWDGRAILRPSDFVRRVVGR